MARRDERDPTCQYLICKVIGGETPGAMFAQKCGSFRVPTKSASEEVKKQTMKDYKNQKVDVEIKIKDKKIEVRVIPSTAQLIIRELKETRLPKKRSGEKIPRHHNYPLPLESLFKIVDEVFENRSRSFFKKGTLKEVLGTAKSVGCTICNKCPKEVTKAVNSGPQEFADLLDIDVNFLPSWLD